MTTLHAPTSDRLPPSPRRPVRVVLIDRDRTVRDAIADLLELDPAICVVGEADTLDRALALLPGLAPDVVILDPRLPDGDGLDICRNLKASGASSRCLVLTSDIGPDSMLDAVRAGAAGYMVKDLTELALTEAIKAIAAGRSHLDRHSTPVLMHEYRRRHRDAPELAETLTTMEMTIMLLLAEGLTNRQIANRLFFSENTIRNYVARLLRKLGLENRTQAALYTAGAREVDAAAGEN